MRRDTLYDVTHLMRFAAFPIPIPPDYLKPMNTLITRLLFAAAILFSPIVTQADVATPSIFGDHVVLQRDQANPIWGWADPGEQVTVSIAGQQHKAKANRQGDWRVTLKPLPAGGPHRLTIKGKNTLEYDDVLVGEVWICSGQSNMQWSVSQSYDGDLVALTGKDSQLRLITVPQVAVSYTHLTLPTNREV